MIITSAEFISSHSSHRKSPAPDKPEFAFIGRSNVGKSSLLNMLTQTKGLAKTSSTPGKTQTINHFLINQSWYLVDLPGYGFASVSKSLRAGFGKMIEEYLMERENLTCLFILIDARLEPQKNDLSFIQWVGSKDIPMAIVFTKSDKISRSELAKNTKKFETRMLQDWEDLPPRFITSAEKKGGRQELLDFIEGALSN